jgi:hypothetical protein
MNNIEKPPLPGLYLGESSSMSRYIHIMYQAYSIYIGFLLEMHEKFLIPRLEAFLFLTNQQGYQGTCKLPDTPAD